MRLYNGCPDDELKAVWDAREEAHKELKKIGARATYFPAEGQYIGFIGSEPVTDFLPSPQAVLEELKNALLRYAKDTIIVDLDGTLCNTEHRNIYAQNGEWEEFHSRCARDDINHAVMEVLQTFGNVIDQRDSGLKWRIIAMTGRNEKWRLMTNEWLKSVGMKQYVDQLYMRPDNCFVSDVELKLGWLEQEFGSHEKARERVLFALDDRDKVVQAFRDIGIDTWQVREGAY